MSLPDVPQESRRSIRAAGDLLRDDAGSIGDAQQARILLAKWRAAHLVPLLEFVKDLNERLRRLDIPGVVAFRLKRLYRTVNKLREQRTMNVLTMQDLGAFRVIVPSLPEVNALRKDYETKPPACSQECKITDYVDVPKEGGYRSVHLMFKFIGPRTSQYNGLRVELQIRTRQQHLWASAVEAVGLHSGAQAKYDQGDPKWNRFFDLTAELIARREGSPRSAEFEDRDDESLLAALREAENALSAVKVMRDFSSEIQTAGLNAQPGGTSTGGILLIQLDRKEKRAHVRQYAEEEVEKAIDDYAEAENKATFLDGQKSMVLVSVTSLATLLHAYQTFFLNAVEFAGLVEELIAPEDQAVER